MRDAVEFRVFRRLGETSPGGAGSKEGVGVRDRSRSTISVSCLHLGRPTLLHFRESDCLS